MAEATTTPTTAWFHCFSGIAGDMALAALVDAGADLDEIRTIVKRVPMSGWSIEAEATMRGGIAATRIVVDAPDTTVVRTYSHIVGLLNEARLPDRVRDRALGIFAAIAQVESRLHRRNLDQVHFHELSGIDAIVDIVGVAAGLELLGVDVVRASPVATGMGMVRTAHGMLPNPAPAVVALLTGVPTHGVDVAVELTTPTGAGILAALAEGFGPLPAMIITSSGFGAGSSDFDALPNLVQVVVGKAESAMPRSGQPVVLIEANLDDATGETLAHAIAALLDAGAHDAWLTPVVMKKGRPAHVVSVLADPARAAELRRVLARETNSFGTRATTYERWPSSRTNEQVEVEGFLVAVKVGGGIVKVEHDDAVQVAARTGLSLRDVVSRAEQAWREQSGTGAEVTELARRPTPPTDDAG